MDLTLIEYNTLRQFTTFFICLKNVTFHKLGFIHMELNCGYGNILSNLLSFFSFDFEQGNYSLFHICRILLLGAILRFTLPVKFLLQQYGRKKSIFFHRNIISVHFSKVPTPNIKYTTLYI